MEKPRVSITNEVAHPRTAALGRALERIEVEYAELRAVLPAAEPLELEVVCELEQIDDDVWRGKRRGGEKVKSRRSANREISKKVGEVQMEK